MQRLRSVFDVIATVLVLVAAAAVLTLTVRNWQQASAQAARQPPAPKAPTSPLPVDGAEKVGSASASLAMIVYSDFQCPYCGKFARETWPSIKKEFVDTGRVLVVFRHFPLPMHNEAMGAALAANCAARQGKFWQVHDLLFQKQQQLSAQTERELALGVGMDATQFDECMQHEARSTDVARDVASAHSLGINSTPTFLIGRIQADRAVRVSEIVLGAQEKDRFELAFDHAAGIK